MFRNRLRAIRFGGGGRPVRGSGRASIRFGGRAGGLPSGAVGVRQSGLGAGL